MLNTEYFGSCLEENICVIFCRLVYKKVTKILLSRRLMLLVLRKITISLLPFPCVKTMSIY